ncbi:MAG TPA: DUF4388 domain-containing protein [Ktedonobacteraceae bacterium]|nr:DUF4388 domain-containing protein [Ktedonobacteraceae bacterium]
MTQSQSYGSSWQGTLRDLANIVTIIRRSRAFGRLTVRNEERLGVAHFYFHAGKLVHIISNRGDANTTLDDVLTWTRATVRFVRGMPPTGGAITEEQEHKFDAFIQALQSRGIAATPQQPRIVEGGIVSTHSAAQLITPQEWRVLVEGTRRISMAVAHLIGPVEAMKVLRDILDDCSAAFPAFTSLQIAPTGYLQVNDTTKFDRMPRGELLEGFAALYSICQYFCAPIIGEADAHKLLIQALGDIGPALVSLGAFQIDKSLLASKP